MAVNPDLPYIVAIVQNTVAGVRTVVLLSLLRPVVACVECAVRQRSSGNHTVPHSARQHRGFRTFHFSKFPEFEVLKKHRGYRKFHFQRLFEVLGAVLLSYDDWSNCTHACVPGNACSNNRWPH